MKNPVNMTREQIVKTTIELIDHQGGVSGVNLREIARLVGCSAPNIYNYFTCLDDLLNTALIRICEDYKTKIQQKTAQISSGDCISSAFQTFIEYAVENPSRINFYYFEKLSFIISPEAEAAAASVGLNMARLLDLGTEQQLPQNKIMEICNILHWYVIGTLSGYITGRMAIENKKLFVSDLVEMCKRIFDSLVRSF